MSYLLEPDVPLAWAEEFLERVPARGHSFKLRHLGLKFHIIRDCLCLGDTSQAIAPVLDKRNLPCIFRESCPYPANEHNLDAIIRKNLAEASSEIRDVIELDEAAPFFPPGASNLWHWTCESLPKLLALEQAGFSGFYILPATALRNEGSVIRQSLAMFGIPEHRLLPSGPIYHVRNMFLPPRLSGFELADNLALCSFLREKLLEAAGTGQGPDRLYVRRIARRRILNEEDVLQVLSDFGFATMTPEELSLRDQWRTMTSVECSVMAHGANSTLSLLQKPGSGMVEMFSNRYVSYNNLHAVRLLKLRYYPLVEELDASCYPSEQNSVRQFLLEGMQADLPVDTLHLRIALEGMLDG